MVLTLESIGALIGIMTGSISLLLSLYVGVVRYAKLELKVDTLWDFQMRRAEAEAVNRGIGRRNSPLKISDEAKTWLEDIAEDLREFYQTHGKDLQRRDLFIELERLFGDRLVERVCLPKDLTEGVALLIAEQVAKDGGYYPPKTQQIVGAH